MTDLEVRAAVAGTEFVTTGGADILFKKGDIVNRLSFAAHHDIDTRNTNGQFEYTGLIGGFKPCKPTKEDPCPPVPGTVDTEGQIHGIVLCFLIDLKGNAASVGGLITHASDPKMEGLQVMWDVTDNGEGAGAPADMTSILLVGDANSNCFKAITLDLFPVETGNVQVHR